MSYDNLMPRLELIRKYLPDLEHIYTATRVSDMKNKKAAMTGRSLASAKANRHYELGKWLVEEADERYWWAVMPRCCRVYLQKKLRLGKFICTQISLTLRSVWRSSRLISCTQSSLITACAGLPATVLHATDRYLGLTASCAANQRTSR